MIFVLGEYFAHVEKLLVIGMEHEQLPTNRDQGPLQLFWQSVEKRLLDCREALLKILQIEHILLDQRFQKREKQDGRHRKYRAVLPGRGGSAKPEVSVRRLPE